ncbi:hypothetical protein ColKHC_12442 [Colletotrichum higginsianum]|nr:hypothetical protein ColKHC_12442 [Colletotrichum higginsianum]
MTCRRSSVFTAVMLAWLRDACEMEASTGRKTAREAAPAAASHTPRAVHPKDSLPATSRQTRPAPPADALRQGSRVETSDGDVLLRRIGKCLSFGCTPRQTADAAALVRDIADNWLAIQMTLAARSPQARDLVYTGALWKDNADRILDPSTPRPWKGIGRHAQLVRVGQEAAVRFLDYSLATAPPRYQQMWEKLRDEGERNHGHEVPPHLELADVWLAHVDNRVLQTQNVSALARLDSHKRFLDNGEFTLTVSIWSHRYIAKLADATVLVTYNTNTAHRNETFLNKELRRMADLGLDPQRHITRPCKKERPSCAPLRNWKRTPGTAPTLSRISALPPLPNDTPVRCSRLTRVSPFFFSRPASTSTSMMGHAYVQYSVATQHIHGPWPTYVG